MKAYLIIVSAVLIAANVWADSLTVGSPATGANGAPFGGTRFAQGTRYQQAYSGNDFSVAGEPIVITGISFLSGAGTLAPSTFTLYFSTIAADIDSLSKSNFDSNLGADNALFASVALSGSAAQTLTFTGNPFTYDRSRGNLLLDIVVSPPAVITGIGAAYLARTNAFGLFSRYHDFGAGNAGFGLVTRFDYVVPLAFRADSLTVSNGILHVLLTGPSAASVVVDGTSTFTNWTPMTTNILPPGGTWQLSLPFGTNRHQFYRARLGP